MNFWEEKNQFWGNKTTDNAIYNRQAVELRGDLATVCKTNSLKIDKKHTFADIGGYKGRIGLGKVFDIVDGFDISKDWASQGFKKDVEICFTSLVLICFDRPTVYVVLEQMIRHSKTGIYLFEEAFNSKYDAGGQINADYGGKWSHDWALYLNDFGLSYRLIRSEVNPAWVRIYAETKRK